MDMNTTTIRTLPGVTGQRTRCGHCRAIIGGIYVDDGTGQPLRDGPFCVMAGEAMGVCPKCGANIRNGGWESTQIKGRITDGPCGPDCREAISDKCRCSCGGANHGMAG